MKRERGYCHVANQFCLCPPQNHEPSREDRSTSCECFACGQYVCISCSNVRNYLEYGRKRLCDDCQIEHDGHERNVAAKQYRKAGYPHLVAGIRRGTVNIGEYKET